MAAAAPVAGTRAPSPYRDPALLLPRVDTFRYFVVLAHGQLVPHWGGTFPVPPDTMVIQTGATEKSCGLVTLRASIFSEHHYDTHIGPYFNQAVLPYTFSYFLGLQLGRHTEPVLDTLLFNPSGELAMNRSITLTESDIAATGRPASHPMGVFELRMADGARLYNEPMTRWIVDNTPSVAAPTRRLIYQPDVVNYINSNNTGSVNVIIFMSCSLASSGGGNDIYNSFHYTRAVDAACTPSHYSEVRYRGPVPKRPATLPSISLDLLYLESKGRPSRGGIGYSRGFIEPTALHNTSSVTNYLTRQAINLDQASWNLNTRLTNTRHAPKNVKAIAPIRKMIAEAKRMEEEAVRWRATYMTVYGSQSKLDALKRAIAAAIDDLHADESAPNNIGCLRRFGRWVCGFGRKTKHSRVRTRRDTIKHRRK
jgi:hypothetical protein